MKTFQSTPEPSASTAMSDTGSGGVDEAEAGIALLDDYARRHQFPQFPSSIVEFARSLEASAATASRHPI